MTTNEKRGLILFGLDVLTFLMGFAGFILIIGSAGALDHNNITEAQFYIQILIAFGMLGLTYIVGKFREALLRYYRKLIKKENKENR